MKSSKKSQARHIAPKAEPFADVAARAGHALADLVAREDCPADVADAISELETRIFNHQSDLEISLRHSFPYRLAAMLERPA